jgi:hypothetical protein
MFDEDTVKIYNKVMIFFNGDLESLKEFVKRASKYGDLEVRKGRWVCDPRSLLGMLSLDLTEPVTLVYPEDKQVDVFMDFGGYIIKE